VLHAGRNFANCEQAFRINLEKIIPPHIHHARSLFDPSFLALKQTAGKIKEITSQRIGVLGRSGEGKSSSINAWLDASCLSVDEYRALQREYVQQGRSPALSADSDLDSEHFFMLRNMFNKEPALKLTPEVRITHRLGRIWNLYEHNLSGLASEARLRVRIILGILRRLRIRTGHM
jgi:hypothetical protein